MTDKHAIHHINYLFSPAGLSPEECKAHAAAATAALSEHFNIAPDRIRVKFEKVEEPIDIRVMRAAGATHDYERNRIAYKLIVPMLRAAQYRPKLLEVLEAPDGIGTKCVVRVAKPPVSGGM